MACSVNTSKKVELEKLRFSYTDDAYIFFRNMRQTHYDLEVMEEGGWRIYRHEDRQQDTSGFYFNVSLVVNWKLNRVYPIIEMTEQLKKEGLVVEWRALESEESGKITLEGMKRRDEMLFVSKIYNKMTEEVEFFISIENQKTPLFPNTDAKEAFRISLYDFYRMTGLL
tara:strand:+ start:254 stop:760 length:507 start_codon:yes stop_codon:yes gene_type:complete